MNKKYINAEDKFVHYTCGIESEDHLFKKSKKKI